MRSRHVAAHSREMWYSCHMTTLVGMCTQNSHSTYPSGAVLRSAISLLMTLNECDSISGTGMWLSMLHIHAHAWSPHTTSESHICHEVKINMTSQKANNEKQRWSSSDLAMQNKSPTHQPTIHHNKAKTYMFFAVSFFPLMYKICFRSYGLHWEVYFLTGAKPCNQQGLSLSTEGWSSSGIYSRNQPCQQYAPSATTIT